MSIASLPLRAGAELERRRRAGAATTKSDPPRTIKSFTLATFPDYRVNWHHRVLCETLDKFLAGEIRRLMVFMPPRHGKSELVSRRLPAYALARNPDQRIIACSYGDTLASRLNRDVQRIIDNDRFRSLYPDTRLYGENVRTMARGAYLRNSDIFEIVGHHGYYISAGVGGAITGMGFDIGIIDDPIKNQKDANSQVYRDAVYEWYGSTFYTRAEKEAGILLTATRWHSDDLAGRLLNQEDGDEWVQLSFSAVKEDDENSHDPRAIGEALWPDKYGARVLEKIKGVLGSYKFSSLYQQRPRPREGGMFKEIWLPLVDAVPREARRVRWWDTAATDGGGDFTAGVLFAEANGIYYVEDVKRGQWGSGERDRTIRNTAETDKIIYDRVEYWSGQEPGASGKDAAAAFIRLLSGFIVHTMPETGSKEIRADPLASQAEAGNVRVKRANWSTAYISEMCGFPTGAHDDQVDGSSGAFNRLTGIVEANWSELDDLGTVEEYKSRWR